MVPKEEARWKIEHVRLARIMIMACVIGKAY
jgi:hypothetical protein